ncbi:MAG TPA: dihydrolipoyl dehydrogenase [Candidatus Tectomicrobia bacterium]|nr:dihydrolipoyl dehydrogenase [Candidatus Tectomicrobia bacterium]
MAAGEQEFQVLVIGGGPGGYVAAIRAAQLGIKVALVERDRLGGVCLNWGCIPTKALLRNAEVLALAQRGDEFGLQMQGLTADYRKAQLRSREVADRLARGVAYLLRKNNIPVLPGVARLRSATQVEVHPRAGGAGQVFEAGHIILATGSRERLLPGVTVDGRRVWTSYEALQVESAPESLIIIGAGAVGVEFASVFAAYGTRVTLIEMLPTLVPLEDPEIAEVLEHAFRKRGMQIMTAARVEKVEVSDRDVRVVTASPHGTQELSAAALLLAVGRSPNTEELGLEAIGVTVERGFVQVNGSQQTSLSHVYAIGDLTGPPLLAHKAMAEGVIAAEHLAGYDPKPLDRTNIPNCTYCNPQIASIGLTEQRAREARGEVKIGKFPFRASGRALAMAETEGLVKLVADAQFGEILGAHIIGPEATEMIAEVAALKTLEATLDELFLTVHAHPTLAEALLEAALAADGRAVHL